MITAMVEIDRICDYIPVISTVSNLLVVFQKCVFQCLPEETSKNRYWTHINSKEISRCLILLVPIIGNVYIITSDYFDYENDKASCDKAIESNKKIEKALASIAASSVSLIIGQPVSTEQMMPTPLEDQESLLDACFNNEPETIRALLAKGVCPNFYHRGETPLVATCYCSTAEVVQLLIRNGADINTPNAMGMRPFSAACMKGDLEMVRVLRPLIADINAAGPRGVTSLMLAAAFDHKEVVEFLISEGADPLQKDATHKEDAISTAILFNRVDLLPFLLPRDRGFDDHRYEVQFPSSSFLSPPYKLQGLTLLLYATFFGAEDCAIYCVERSNVQLVDSSNSNALHYASKKMQVLRALLRKCRDPAFINHQNNAGLTPLHYAIKLDQPDAALLLLEHGADPLLAENGPPRVLLKDEKPIVSDDRRQVLVTCEKGKGKTPLLLACEKGMANVVEAIKLQHRHRITEEINHQISTAIEQAASALRDQAPQDQPERSNALSDQLGLIKSIFQLITPERKSAAQKLKDLGSEPRTGMELIFGKLPWPV